MGRTGITTRIVDRCIQELFKNGVTYVYEGRGPRQGNNPTHEVFHRFRRRLHTEHQSVVFKHEYGIFDGINCYKVELQKIT
jgi:hypothetical protein